MSLYGLIFLLDIPAVFISTVLACHFGLRIPQVESFLVLQNRDPMTGLYSKAWTDLNFIFFWIVVFTFLRAFVMTMILKPIAVRCGVKKEHQRTRFQEEGWVCLYYSLSWTLGMVSSTLNTRIHTHTRTHARTPMDGSTGKRQQESTTQQKPFFVVSVE